MTRTRAMLLMLAVFALGADTPPPTLDELLDIAPPEPIMPLMRPQVDDSPAAPRQQQPMQAVIEQMRSASQRLGRERDTGLATQRLQQAILNRIDQMIKAAQQSQQSGNPSESSDGRKQDQGNQGNAQQQKSAGQRDSTQASRGDASAGSPREGEVNNDPLHQRRVEWGNLPPRVRDELLQGSAERFSPIYRVLTEEYYRRLAEENR